MVVERQKSNKIYCHPTPTRQEGMDSKKLMGTNKKAKKKRTFSSFHIPIHLSIQNLLLEYPIWIFYGPFPSYKPPPTSKHPIKTYLKQSHQHPHKSKTSGKIKTRNLSRKGTRSSLLSLLYKTRRKLNCRSYCLSQVSFLSLYYFFLLFFLFVLIGFFFLNVWIFIKI